MVALVAALVALTAFYGLCMAAFGWFCGTEWQYRRDYERQLRRVNEVRRSYGLPPMNEYGER